MFHVDQQFLANLFSYKAILNLKEEVPTHTEDGIPIRKLFVSNLPSNTSRFELMEIFRQYGWIKSCWLRMEDKSPNAPPSAVYAFITYANPEHAHNALKAPNFQKVVRGKFLKIKPADSWHQPIVEGDEDNPRRRNAQKNKTAQPSTSGSTVAAASTSSTLPEHVSGEEFNITDRLNRDCIMHIFSYIPLPEILKIQRVCKSWKFAIEDYVSGIRTLKTSDCDTRERHLTTAMLRCVLFHTGAYLTKLHLDQDSFMLNDRAVQAISKYCPDLLELKLFGILGSSFSALFYGCKKLKILNFDTCPMLTDKSLMALTKCPVPLESLKITSSPEVSGTFLSYFQFVQLKQLTVQNCFQLQLTHLLKHIKYLENLTVLKIDETSANLWPTLPEVISQLPNLEKLSLSTYARPTNMVYDVQFFRILDLIPNIKELRFSRNYYITNGVLSYIAEKCTKLEVLDIAGCNSEVDCPDEKGIKQIISSCKELRYLNLSYLQNLNDPLLKTVSKLPLLKELILRGSSDITAEPFPEIFDKCKVFEFLDVCGCEGVNFVLIEHAVAALEKNPRKLKLLVATSSVMGYDGPLQHPLLQIDNECNTCNPLFMPNNQHVFYGGSGDDDDDEDDDDDDYDFSDPYDMFEYSESENFFSHSDSDEWDRVVNLLL